MRPVFQEVLAAYGRGQLDQALELCSAVLKSNPKHAEALHLKGVLIFQRLAGQTHVTAGSAEQIAIRNEAISLVKKALVLSPENANFLTSLGTLYRVSDRLAEAKQAFRQAIRFNPREVLAHDGLGQTLQKISRYDASQKGRALACFKTAIELNPRLDTAYLSAAELALELGEIETAIHWGTQALVRRVHMPVLELLTKAHRRHNDDGTALQYCERAVTEFPHSPAGHALMAETLLDLQDFDRALLHAGRAYAIGGEANESVLETLVYALECAGKPDEAKTHFERTLWACVASPWYFRFAAFLLRQGVIELAQRLVATAFALENGHETHLSQFFKRFTHDWRATKGAIDFLQTAAASMHGRPKTRAQFLINFSALQLTGTHFKNEINFAELSAREASDHLFLIHCSNQYTRAELFSLHRQFNDVFAPPATQACAIRAAVAPAKRLRVGYLSQDFRVHSVAYFLEAILERHHSQAVEVFCYYNHSTEDAVTRRFKTYCTGGWRHCHDWTDEKLANKIRQDKIDILVDLMGHTGRNRMLVLASKPAPIQVSYLGYPDTTGLTAIDYRLTDEVVEPAGAQAFSTETLLHMPVTYFRYRPSDIAARIPISELPCLRKGYVTFGSFNVYQKITDDQIRLWVEILHRVPNSRLLLKVRGYSGEMRHFKTLVQDRFIQYGMPPECLILQDYAQDLEKALKTYDEVDLCLDTFPYSGATTTCESLWMGCPVVSLYGETHVSRMSLSILSAVGLADLATNCSADYIAKAVELATSIERLAEVRKTLRARVQASPLMDYNGLVDRLEAVYRQIWQAWCTKQQAGVPKISPFASLNKPSGKSIEHPSTEDSKQRNHQLFIVTTIAPRNVEHQAACIKTWSGWGGVVHSINTADEIKTLRKHFPQVTFVECQRTAAEKYGKPLIYLDDLLDFRTWGADDVIMIINSDINFSDDLFKTNDVHVILEKAEKALIFSNRFDVMTDGADQIYPWGFDIFVLPAKYVNNIPKSEYAIGAPWWDYYLPMLSLLGELKIPSLHWISNHFQHKNHPANYSIALHTELAYYTNKILFPVDSQDMKARMTVCDSPAKFLSTVIGSCIWRYTNKSGALADISIFLSKNSELEELCINSIFRKINKISYVDVVG